MQPALQDTSPTQDHKLRLLTWLWVAYLGAVPLVWFPGVPTNVVLLTKTMLFAVAIAGTWALSKDRSLPTGITGPVGFAVLVLASSFSMFQAPSLAVSVRQLWEIGLAFGVMWTVRIYRRNLGNFTGIAAGAVALHGLWSAMIVISYIVGAQILSPGALGELPIIDTGLAAARTGWSISVAVLLPFATAAAILARTMARRVWLIVAIVTVIAGQTVVGGRSGILAGLIGIAAVVWIRYGSRAVILGAITITTIAVTFTSFLDERLRFSLPTNVPTSTIDRLSSGRLTGIREALDLISARPILGYGYQQPTVGFGLGGEGIIHNVWLRLTAEGGLFLAVSLAVVVATILATGLSTVRWLRKRNLKDESVHTAAAVGAISAGIIISLFEPATIVGSMFDGSLWWASAGILMAGTIELIERERGTSDD